MQANRSQHEKTHKVLVQAALLGLLALVAVSMALLALIVPDANVEVPIMPEFVFSPPSPHFLP